MGASATTNQAAARKVEVVYGRFSVGLGLHFEARVTDSVTLFANVGLLVALAFDETWTFTRQSAAGEQRYSTVYDPGLGAFGEGGLLVYANERFAFRIGAFLEGVSTAFDRQVWQSGTGAWAGEATGTVVFSSGDFADDTAFDANGIRRVHKSNPLGFLGALGSWGFSIGVVLWF